MRTTLSLDPDVAESLKAEVALRKRSFKEVVNTSLRRGLKMGHAIPSKPFRVIPHSSAFLPGIDPEKLNQLTDELDAVEFVKKRNDDHP